MPKLPGHTHPQRLPQVRLDRCTGCGRCVSACPPKVLWLQTERPDGMGPKHAHLHDAAHCTGCADCAVTCPFHAIRMAACGTMPT